MKRFFKSSKLVIPKKLQKELPYNLKPKMRIENEEKMCELVNRHKAIYLDPEQKKIYKTMDILRTVKNDHLEKSRQALKLRQKKHEKEIAEIEDRRKRKMMTTKKSICRNLSKKEAHRLKNALDEIGA